MTYFNNIKDLSVLRKLYYKLAMKHHPDRVGGDVAIMQTINSEYEAYSKLLINGNTEFSNLRKVYENEVSQELKLKINQIILFEYVTIEVIGSWLWVTGTTFPVKDKLKALDFKYSPNKQAWYYHSKNYIKMGGKQFSMDGIRKLWGSQEIEKKPSHSLVLN